MDIAFEDKIRQRAYEIWLAAGMQGDADEHWLSAETHLRSPSDAKTRKSAPKAKAATAAVKVRSKSAPKAVRSAKVAAGGASAGAF